MAQENDYTLISVDADEQDDVVIQAGAVKELPSEQVVRPKADDASAEREGKDAPPAGGVPPAIVDQAADEEARKEYERHMKQREARRAAQEMVTTEDDLRAKTPFAGMRMAILALFALLVCAALVYWFVLR
ncbi:MAG: hypothetical protein IJ131_00255 [Eggerthellaceae bacterium]|nr:hypothetical protein [Eggerthellaceae bacterium]